MLTIAENVLISDSLASLLARFDDPEVDAAIWERPITDAALFFKDVSSYLSANIRFSKVFDHLAAHKNSYLSALKQDLAMIKSTYCRLLPDRVDNLDINYDLEVQIRVNNNTITPIWHTDRLGKIRVLINYLGAGTEWVPRSAIRGPVIDNKAIPDSQINESQIRRTPENSVIFIKCPEYFSRKHIKSKQQIDSRLGFVHRTPDDVSKRLLLVFNYHNIIVLKTPRTFGTNRKIDYYFPFT